MHTAAVSPAVAEQVLALLHGERVRLSNRPIAHAVSPWTVTGIDCRVGVRSGAQVRGVGTLAGHVTLTGGRVLQGSVVAQLARSPDGGRRPWSHYLARPGVVETIGGAGPVRIGEAHLAAERHHSTMGMGAVCRRLLARIQESPH